ncbi:phosphoribosyl-ATP diphosphatase [Stomatohabitans albus]|uniref:phosphoribosyl-ATP diphosphatase n=1 Tax=Stomatohabitans albus TaxID=3110766 RepID=UPI00300BFA8D
MPDDIMHRLSARIAERAVQPQEGSYTNTVLADPLLAQRKVMEEAFETCLEVREDTTQTDHDAIAGEAADVIFHLLVLLRTQGVGWQDVERHLVDRFGSPARHSTYGNLS